MQPSTCRSLGCIRESCNVKRSFKMKESTAMNDKTIEIEDVTLQFRKEKGSWQLTMPKSQTNLKDIKQMDLLKETSDYFAPLQAEEQEDAYLLHYSVEEHWKSWENIRKLPTNEKLRLLNNTAKLE